MLGHEREREHGRERRTERNKLISQRTSETEREESKAERQTETMTERNERKRQCLHKN